MFVRIDIGRYVQTGVTSPQFGRILAKGAYLNLTGFHRIATNRELSIMFPEIIGFLGFQAKMA